MAAWIELSERLENGIGADARLHVHAAYHGTPLPQWLTQPIDETAQHAAERVPVTVLNVKGHRPESALCILSLCDFERLLSPAIGAHGDAVARARNGDAEAAAWLRLMRPDEVE